MAEQQQEDFSKLSLEDKLAHKVWKARLMGYEEATKLFKRIDDENSPEYSPFVGLVRKFPVESNAMAQEKAMEATFAFVECAAAAGKICSEVVAGIVTKCLNARSKTKDMGVAVCLMYVETEKQDIVLEEILKGLSNKQPKIVAASILVLRQALQEFGARVINMKVLLKAVPGMFEHTDKTVRSEAKLLAKEIFRWVGAALKASIDGKIKPVQMKELEEEFAKLPGDPAVPTRLLRSQQQVVQATPTSSGGGEAVGGAVLPPQPEAIDPFDLLEAVNILQQMPKDFYEKIGDVKWKERKEALEALLPLAQSPKIEEGDFGELIKTLKKIISKDSNVLVIVLAANVITGLAKGLRKKFSPYASSSLSVIFEKFKEKKLNVVTSLREAADSVFLTTNLTAIQDETVEALNNKNPSVKAETLLFLARCYSQCIPAMIPKPYLKTMCPLVVQRLDDTTPQVRDSACEVLGTLLKLLGDRPMVAYIETVDKTKMTKINEFKEKVELKAPPPGSMPEAKPEAKPEPAPPKDDEGAPPKKKPVLSSQKKPPKKKVAASGDDVSSEGGGDKPAEPPPRKKPAAEKKPAPAKSAGAGGGATAKSKAKPGAIGKTDEPPDVPEPNITAEEVDEKASEVLPSGLLDQLAHANWKERLAGHEQFKEFVESLPPDQMQSLLFVKVLARKPGWKDSNFQVMKGKFQVVTVLAEKSTTFGKKTTACVVPALVDKFADIKVKGQCSETLLMIAEKMTLNYTSLQVMKNAFEHKSPKVQSEALDWLSQGLKEFGFLLNVKPHVDYIKKAFAATNPAVRTAAINLLATMHMYLGAQLRMFFEEEKAALLQQIDAAFEKSAGETPPPPTRGPNVRSGEEEAEEGGESEASGGGAALSLADLMPKVDISAQIKPEIIKELNDKNWKIRGEALQKVQDIVTQAKFIQPSLGELPGALKARLGDSNKNLVITTLNIIASLGAAMGSSCSKFNKVLIPSVLTTLADSKPQVRNAGIACLNGWVAEVKFASLVEQDLLAPALANENPNLRIELLGWFEEKLPDIGKLPSEVQSLVPLLFACLEDRSADVRKKAQVVLPLLMVPVGYDVMLKHTGKLKPASKQTVKALLDKHRPSVSAVPTKPSAPSEEKTTPPKGSAKKSSASVKGKSAAKSRPKTTGGKDADEEDESSVLTLIPHGKEQRMKDEEKLKILKWNFQLPRPEHIDQLKDQLLSCVSLSIHKKLFHEDFKQQLAAVATLTEAINKDVDAAIGCSDLLLRWVTLRFFDTNTTVNMKCLEFLHTLFHVLTTAGYRMSEYEAGAFLPYLVIKVGDPKDPVRKAVRNLFRDICNFYPPGKLFTYIMDGLKSKNARQRTECLELLGELIQNNGMIICQPNPQKTLPLIAAQITDRDNAVRSAALNAMVVVYGNVGEGVYKFTSQLSEKDVSLLEERIKRSGKVVQPHQQQQQLAKSKSPSPLPPTPEPEINEEIVEKPPSPVLVAKTTSPKGSSLPKFTGPFSLDMKKYSSRPRSHLIRPRVSRPDLSGLEGDIKMLSYTTSKLVGNPPKPLSISPARMATTSSAISYIISQITSSDIEVSSKALAQIEVIATSSEQQSILATHIDQLLRAILMQKRINFTTHLSMATSPKDYQRVLEMSRTLAGVLTQVFLEVSLAKKVRQETLVELERDIFGYLIDDRLHCLENIAQLNRVYNVLMGHVVENTDRNAIFGSLLQVMLETLGPDGSSTKLSDMAMKCLWRLTRQLQDVLPVLNVDQLLRDLDVFFAGHASLNPTPSPNDKPYRTVKTILYHLANIMKSEVLDHLSLIKDQTSSPVVQYLHKTVKKRSISGNKTEMKKSIEAAAPALATPITKVNNPLEQGTLPADVASHFTTILETIKNPSTTQQGFEELYDFREAHPEIDVKACFSSTSHFFQAYIERNLDKVPQWRQSTLPQRAESEDFEKIRKGLENVRLRASQVVTNWDQHNSQSQISKSEPVLKEVSSDENKDPLMAKILATQITDGSATIVKRKAPPPSTSQTSLKLDDLRKRLDRIKGTQ